MAMGKFQPKPFRAMALTVQIGAVFMLTGKAANSQAPGRRAAEKGSGKTFGFFVAAPQTLARLFVIRTSYVRAAGTRDLMVMCNGELSEALSDTEIGFNVAFTKDDMHKFYY